MDLCRLLVGALDGLTTGRAYRRADGRAFLLGVAVVGALAVGCQGEGESSKTRPAGSGTETAVDTTPTETGETADAALVVSGRGPTERSIEVPNDYVPFILGARYPKGSSLTVRVRGEGFRQMKGRRGPFLFDNPETSVTATPGIASGTYELVVKGTKGPWSLQFNEPDPDMSAALFGQVIEGDGDTVGTVHISEATEVRWEMQTDGAFFTARLLGFNDAEGARQSLGVLTGGLVLEPGNRGLRSDSALLEGDYLLIVDADGRWAMRFEPID